MGYHNNDVQALRLKASAKQALQEGEPKLSALLRTWSDRDAAWMEEYLKNEQKS